MDTKLFIRKYLDDHKLSWAPSTLKSETARLNSVSDKLLPQDPEFMWGYLESTQRPYARVTTWIRIVDFINWLLDNNHINGTNLYAQFRTKNRRLFKNCYQRRLPNLSYQAGAQLLAAVQNDSVRTTAQHILETGMRASEALSVTNNFVVGKGGKQRKVYVQGTLVQHGLTYNTLYANLKKQTGLTPHMLRKLCMTRLVELGASPFELCKIAGWNSLETARSYIATDDKKIKELMDKVKNCNE